MKDSPTKKVNIDFSTLRDGGPNTPPSKNFIAQDGTKLFYRKFAATKSNNILILIHGSAGHSAYLQRMSQQITDDNIAHVYTPDVRGHGFSPQRRGDLDYIGQLEDDLQDFISLIKKEHPDKKIILGGHSSGGSLALRYAAKHKDIDALLLLTPYLGHDAPTTRTNNIWAQPLLARLLSLMLLNKIGIAYFNYVKTLAFNIPEQYLSPSITSWYSYRMMVNFQTDDYKKDFSKIKKPILLIIGSEDESFIPEKYQPSIETIAPQTEFHIIEGYQHMNLITQASINDIFKKWLTEQK